MLNFLSVNNVAFVLLGYPMSYVELFGTILYLWSVWLIVERKVLTWPVGILSVLLYMALFYQIHLYSDTLEQLYYLGASIYGWVVWKKSPKNDGQIADVVYSSKQIILIWTGVTIFFSAVLGVLMGRIHILLPTLFPEAASFPFLDALTTIMSFTAMWLMAKKKIESWIYWIVVDVIGIWLYFIKDVKFVSLLYMILLVMAIKGLYSWHQSQKQTATAERVYGSWQG